MWVGASQSDAHQPIRTSVSETKEAVYRPMRGASWDEEQTSSYQVIKPWFHKYTSGTHRSDAYIINKVVENIHSAYDDGFDVFRTFSWW